LRTQRRVLRTSSLPTRHSAGAGFKIDDDSNIRLRRGISAKYVPTRGGQAGVEGSDGGAVRR
jgi:hypothetical protein